MCGIAGIWSARNADLASTEHLEGMLETLHHRGPDGRGRHIERERGLAIGHTRLSINDLEGGAQPLVSRDGRFVLAVNGEFYNFKRARAMLMAQGDRFTTRSDSELAIALYRKHGLDFFQYLRGEFAFALFDRETETLMLVRDRFGIRPMFYRVAQDTLYFGSEVKALLSHPEVPRELSTQAALHQLMQTMVPGTTAFSGIDALLPGHALIIKKRGERLEVQDIEYWDMIFPHDEERSVTRSNEEWVEEVRTKLVDAVALRLVADVPVGCYLSGGIDSCSILGLASGAQQSPVKAFTIAFDHDDYDESHIAKEMAESMGAEQEMIRLGAKDLYGENYVRTAWHSERTFYNTLGVAKYCMSRRVQECGYKTVVTGEGADELFGGYPAFKRDMFLHSPGTDDATRAARERALGASNEVFKGAILPETARAHPAFDATCGFTPSWIQSWMGTLEMARPLLSDDAKRSLGAYDPIEAVAQSVDATKLEDRHPLDRAQYSWIKTMLEGQILNWGGDRVDMANSMESRPAFLDHKLAEAATHIPPDVRIHGTTEKWVLREAMRGVLPKVLYEREKFAFMAPPAHTDDDKQAELDKLTRIFLSPDKIRDAGLLDPDKVKTFLETPQPTAALNVRKDALINHVLCLHVLHDQFITQKPAAPPVFEAA